MTKQRVQGWLQRSLGLQRYLFLFSLYAIVKLRWAEPAFFQFLSLLPDEGVLLDVGANLGSTTTFLARMRPNASVVAFEPVPWNAANIQRLAKLLRLRNVSVRTCAAGDRSGCVDFVVPVVCGARMHGLGHLGNLSGAVFNESREQGEHFKVASCRLDDLGLERVTGLKLDVENSEYGVLCGGEQLLKRWRPVIYCELWQNENRQRSLELLVRLGYTPYMLQTGQLTAFAEKGGVQNLIFLPRESDYSGALRIQRDSARAQADESANRCLETSS